MVQRDGARGEPGASAGRVPRRAADSTAAPPIPQGGECVLYIDGVRQPGEIRYPAAFARAQREDRGFVWLSLWQPDEAEFADVARTFQLHELAAEDAVKASQRPKIELYEHVTFLVLRTIRYREHAERTDTADLIHTGNVLIFLGARFVITVWHGDASGFDAVRTSLDERPDLLSYGPWAVLHRVCDQIVDTYLSVVGAMENDIDNLEERVFSRRGEDVQRIYQIKRDLVEFRRAVVPLRRPLDSLVRGDVPGVPMEIRRYIRDIADHLSRVTEQIAGFDDLVNSMLQARLAQVSVEQNNDMRKIAAWAAIAAVQTTIAGVYGMNFDLMPELHWKYGYFAVLGLMVTSAVVLYRLFRRSGWL